MLGPLCWPTYFPEEADDRLIKIVVAIYYKELSLENVSYVHQAKLPEKIREITKKYRIRSIEEFMQSIPFKVSWESTRTSRWSSYFLNMMLYLLRCIKKLEEAALAVWDCSTKCELEVLPI